MGGGSKRLASQCRGREASLLRTARTRDLETRFSRRGLRRAFGISAEKRRGYRVADCCVGAEAFERCRAAGPMPRGACLLYSTRRASFALASGEWGFRRADLVNLTFGLVNLTFGLPNADFTSQMRYAGLNLASYLCWTIGRSNL